MRRSAGEAGPQLWAVFAVGGALGCAQILETDAYGVRKTDDSPPAGDAGAGHGGAGPIPGTGMDEAGAGGEPGAPPFPELAPYLSTGECQTCLQSQCAEEWAACLASDACAYRIDCEADCTDAACADICRHEARRLLYPTTADLVEYQQRKLDGDPTVPDVLIPLAKCDETACAAACGADVPDFSCAGRYDPPRQYRRGTDLEVIVALHGIQAGVQDHTLPGYEVFGCSSGAPSCEPVAPAQADDVGVAVMALTALVDEGFPWPLRARLNEVNALYGDFLYSRTLPMFDGFSIRSFPIPIETYRDGCRQTFDQADIDCESEEFAGYAATVRDCQRRVAGGLRLDYVCGPDKCLQQPTAYGRNPLVLQLEPPSERKATFQFIGGTPPEADYRVFVAHDGSERIVAVSSVIATGHVGHHEDVFPITRSEVERLRSEPWARHYEWPDTD